MWPLQPPATSLTSLRYAKSPTADPNPPAVGDLPEVLAGTSSDLDDLEPSPGSSDVQPSDPTPAD